MKEIIDLPINDIWPLIFRNLSIENLFNCRLVNKQFKYFSDHTDGINKLIIGEPNSKYDDYFWYYNNKLIEDKEIISLKCFKSIKLLSIFNLAKYLKYLKIYDQEFKTEEISNLINLESLEFGHYYNGDKQTINLNNLKVFASNYNLLVKLNTPKLEKIKLNNINRIKLDNSESIKHLITYDYANEFEQLKNLEIMELRALDQSLNENLLTIFKNLKQLKINSCFERENYFERIKNNLIKILNDKIKLRRSIDIYFEGIRIANIDKLNELKTDDFPYWKSRLNNYDLLDLNLTTIESIHYEKLDECTNNIKNDLPTTFFDKFQNIHYVYVNGVKNVDDLNWFLNNLKYLIELKIDSTVSLLGEVFYNNLPNTIRCLFLYNGEDINYDFILKLSKLIEFETKINKDLFDLLFTSYSNLKYLNYFKFYFKNNVIIIMKKDQDFYLNNRIELDYNQLLIECNKIRSK